MKLILKDATVLLPGGAVKEADIAIENGRIAAIGAVDAAAWQDADTRDCKGKFAMPGLVNAHTHAAMTLLRSYADDMNLMDWLEKRIWPIEAQMSHGDIYWGTQLAIAEMLKSGTTAFADMYGDMDIVAQVVAETGARASLARGMIGVAPNGRQALAENKALYAEYHGAADGRITVMFGPHAPYTCPPDFLKDVVAEAQKVGADIHIHLSETVGEVETCRKTYGKSPIGLMEEIGVFECGVLAAHCVHISAGDIGILKRRNVRIAHNPGSNMKLASGVAPVPEMLESGLCVALGTDGASSNNNLDMFEEMHLAALLHKVDTLDPLVVPALTAVQMATENGARALGIEAAVGTLEVGKRADIALLDMQRLNWCPRHDLVSLLAYATNASQVDTVLVDGKVLLDGGKLTTIDEERVRFEAQKRAMRLAESVGEARG